MPLDPLRAGSLSTKTTHPVYMKALQEIWNDVGRNIDFILPYKFKTKGEVLMECKNQELMKKLIFKSTSCGKCQRESEPLAHEYLSQSKIPICHKINK